MVAARAAVGTWELEAVHSVCGLCSLFPERERERDGCFGLDTLLRLSLGEELEPRFLAV